MLKKWSKNRSILATFLAILFFTPSIQAQNYNPDSCNLGIDTVLSYMYKSAQELEANTPNFEANMYMKGNLEITKKNIFLRALPFCWVLDRKNDEYFIETSSTLSYTKPNSYTQTFNAINSNDDSVNKYIESIVLPHIQGNVYSTYMYGNLYSPILPKRNRYYIYNIDSVWQEANINYYKVAFSPRIRSFQLVSGYMIINTNNWSIRELYIKGKTELISFSNHIIMGDIGSKGEFLSKSNNLIIEYKLLGNHIIGEYTSYLKYNNVIPSQQAENSGNKKARSKYDLTLFYNSHYNTQLSNVNFDTIRPIPLTERDNKIIPIAQDTISTTQKTITNVGNFLTSDYSINMNKGGNIEFSPLISPILFNYSSSHGVSYAQKLKYTKLFKGDRLFYIEPKIGYNFKFNELYGWLKSELEYAPKIGGKFFIDIGGGHRVETDRILQDLYALKDTIFNPKTLHLNNFINYHFKVGHKIEITNGLNLSVALAMQYYREVEKSSFEIVNHNSPRILEAVKIAQNNYSSFVPELQLSWTPGQYYYRSGARKVTLHSKYPTFNLNWSFAIKGIFKNSISYNRVEFDMYHKINLSLNKKIYYRFGAGGFFDYSSLYFTDFLNFQRNNLPEGWDDNMGGTFQLLSNFKYSGIDKYIRGHIKFDAPFLIIPTIFKKFPYAIKERIYCNMLYVKTLKPYIELGYGIGTNIFNAGIFFGGEVNKFDLVGFKLTFEIYNN